MSFEKAFIITVEAVSDVPTIDPLDNLDVLEDAAEVSVSLTGITAGPGDSQPLRVTSTSSAPSIIPTPGVEYVSPNTQGTLRFTPLPNAFGSVLITVCVEDGGVDGDLETLGDNAVTSQTFVVLVRAVQDPPAASGDAYTGRVEQTLNVTSPGVLANDRDVDGDMLQAVLVRSVAHGMLQLHPDGSFSYVPAKGFNREDSFEYYVSDGSDSSATVEVTIELQTEYPWNNGINALDVNDDTYVSPLDALLVINELNTNGAHKLAQDRPRPLARPFLDVNCNGYVSPLDALLVINYLIGSDRGSGEGERDVLEATLVEASVLWRGVSSVASPLTSARRSPRPIVMNHSPATQYTTGQLPEIGFSPQAASADPVFYDEPGPDWTLPDLELTLSEIASDLVAQRAVDEARYPLRQIAL